MFNSFYSMLRLWFNRGPRVLTRAEKKQRRQEVERKSRRSRRLHV